MKEIKKLTSEEISSFCSQTAMLLQAGLTPVDSMNIMISDAKSESTKQLLEKIREVCLQGEPFHKALAESKVFPDYVANMLALGEESGTLDECMLSLASYYEKEDAISESIKSAITYPFIMISMMVVVIFVLISKVIPIFNQVFVELGSEMNGFAASLLRLGKTLNRYSIVFIAILIVILLVHLLATRTAQGRKLTARVLSVLPLTKHFYDSVACERFASGMALTLASGMDTYSGLDMVASMVENKAMKAKIAVCKEHLKEGDSFAEAVGKAGIFSNLYSQMMAVGFKSGNIDTVLSKIADNYEKETDKRIQSIISVLEPTLVIILSVIVGMILLSVILPLMGIMTSIG